MKRVRISDEKLLTYLEGMKEQSPEKSYGQILADNFHHMHDWLLEITKAGFKDIDGWRKKVEAWEAWYRENFG